MDINVPTLAVGDYPSDGIDSFKPVTEIEDTSSIINTQKERILSLETAVEKSIKERNELREKLKQASRSLEKIKSFLALKCDIKERELKYFLLPSPPRVGTVSDSGDSQKVQSSLSSTTSTNAAPIKSTVPAVRPVPTLITTTSNKPVDSLLGPPGTGLLPTPTLNQTHNFKPTNLSRVCIPRSVPIHSGKSQSEPNSEETKECSNSNQNNNYYTEVPLDCSVNLILSRLRRTQEQFDQLIANNQAELQSFTFTQNSQNGKRIMMRIRVLEQENEELANMNRTGRIARLESEIALRRKFVDDLKLAHADTEFLIDETDSETELFGGSLQMLQQRLKLAQAKAVVFSSALEESSSTDFIQLDDWSNQMAMSHGSPGSASLSPDTKPIIHTTKEVAKSAPLSPLDTSTKSIRESSLLPNSPQSLVVPKKRSRDTIESHRKFSHPNDIFVSPTIKPPQSPNEQHSPMSYDNDDGDIQPLADSPLCKKSHPTRPSSDLSYVPNCRTRKQRPIIPIKGPQRTFCSSSGHENQTLADESLERTALPKSSHMSSDDDANVIDNELSDPDFGIHDSDSNDVSITANTTVTAAINIPGSSSNSSGSNEPTTTSNTTTHICRNEQSFSGPIQGPPSNGQLGGLRVLE